MHATPWCTVTRRRRVKHKHDWKHDRGKGWVPFLKGWRISDPLPEQACFKAKVKTSLQTWSVWTAKLHASSCEATWGQLATSFWKTPPLPFSSRRTLTRAACTTFQLLQGREVAGSTASVLWQGLLVKLTSLQGSERVWLCFKTWWMKYKCLNCVKRVKTGIESRKKNVYVSQWICGCWCCGLQMRPVTDGRHPR